MSVSQEQIEEAKSRIFAATRRINRNLARIRQGSNAWVRQVSAACRIISATFRAVRNDAALMKKIEKLFGEANGEDPNTKSG